ncbi:MAG: ribosome-associated translation inhibitor RaiA [Candidatus Omnitrophota bacterium]|nr:ribosome-associated translation inhibitor RaiA [Candidatus Omnitrophota bacterium]
MMDINITGRNFDLDNSIKKYVHKRLDKLEKMYRRIYKCEVILEEEKERKKAEIILYLKRNRVVAKEISPDIYASIDNASESIKKQLRRLRGKVSSRRRKLMLSKLMKPVARFGASPEIVIPEQRERIIKSNTFAGKPMLPEEAKLELELMGRSFIMFKNADTGEANVLYKRHDGNYGLIEPDF